MMDMQMYDLDGNPLQGSFVEQLGQSTALDRNVARTVLSNRYTVSTVLLPYGSVTDQANGDLYLFETAIIKPSEEVTVLRQHKTFDEAYKYHCLVVHLLTFESKNVSVVDEHLNERIAKPKKQDFTIHI